jgi:hypothetical protein
LLSTCAKGKAKTAGAKGKAKAAGLGDKGACCKQIIIFLSVSKLLATPPHSIINPNISKQPIATSNSNKYLIGSGYSRIILIVESINIIYHWNYTVGIIPQAQA